MRGVWRGVAAVDVSSVRVRGLRALHGRALPAALEGVGPSVGDGAWEPTSVGLL